MGLLSSVHFSRAKPIYLTQGQANDRLWALEASLIDDKKAGGGLSWQRLLESGRVAHWGLWWLWSSPGYSWEGQLYYSGGSWYAGCGGGNTSNPLPTSPFLPNSLLLPQRNTSELRVRHSMRGNFDAKHLGFLKQKKV